MLHAGVAAPRHLWRRVASSALAPPSTTSDARSRRRRVVQSARPPRQSSARTAPRSMGVVGARTAPVGAACRVSMCAMTAATTPQSSSYAFLAFFLPTAPSSPPDGAPPRSPPSLRLLRRRPHLPGPVLSQQRPNWSSPFWICTPAVFSSRAYARRNEVGELHVPASLLRVSPVAVPERHRVLVATRVLQPGRRLIHLLDVSVVKADPLMLCTSCMLVCW